MLVVTALFISDALVARASMFPGEDIENGAEYADPCEHVPGVVAAGVLPSVV